MRAETFCLQRQDLLPIKDETGFLQRVVDPRGPLHFAAAAHELDIVFLETMYAIATRFLGCRTGTVGSTQNTCDVVVFQ